jgi:hypothetical protein
LKKKELVFNCFNTAQPPKTTRNHTGRGGRVTGYYHIQYINHSTLLIILRHMRYFSHWSVVFTVRLYLKNHRLISVVFSFFTVLVIIFYSGFPLKGLSGYLFIKNISMVLSKINSKSKKNEFSPHFFSPQWFFFFGFN